MIVVIFSLTLFPKITLRDSLGEGGRFFGETADDVVEVGFEHVVGDVFVVFGDDDKDEPAAEGSEVTNDVFAYRKAELLQVLKPERGEGHVAFLAHEEGHAFPDQRVFEQVLNDAPDVRLGVMWARVTEGGTRHHPIDGFAVRKKVLAPLHLAPILVHEVREMVVKGTLPRKRFPHHVALHQRHLLDQQFRQVHRRLR